MGDSIAVNGICLTAVDLTSSTFSADVMPETLRRSSLGSIRESSPVNLERALRLSDRLGGHIVSGHIDGTGTIQSRTPEHNAILFKIMATPELLKYIVAQRIHRPGWCQPDRSGLSSNDFTVSIIPIPPARRSSATTSPAISSTLNAMSSANTSKSCLV